MLARLAKIPSAVLTAVGLIGGFSVAQGLDNRPAGGVVLLVCGVIAGIIWLKNTSVLRTVTLSVVYVGAFAASHPLAKVIGVWPSVLLVAAVAAGAAWLGCDAMMRSGKKQTRARSLA